MSVSEFGVLILIDGYNVLKGVTRGGDVSDKIPVVRYKN